MATVKIIEYEGAGPEVRAVYDDIMANLTNALVNGFQVDLDEAFKDGGRQS
ncbi:MAG: hypothetical protein PVI38_16640 [Desulfobacterales bacterium]|jgi:hypothetical protein